MGCPSKPFPLSSEGPGCVLPESRGKQPRPLFRGRERWGRSGGTPSHLSLGRPQSQPQEAVLLPPGFPRGSDGEESTCNEGDLRSNPGLRRCPENRMAAHSSILAWRIPWTEEPGGLHIVWHDRATTLALSRSMVGLSGVGGSATWKLPPWRSPPHAVL